MVACGGVHAARVQLGHINSTSIGTARNILNRRGSGIDSGLSSIAAGCGGGGDRDARPSQGDQRKKCTSLELVREQRRYDKPDGREHRMHDRTIGRAGGRADERVQDRRYISLCYPSFHRGNKLTVIPAHRSRNIKILSPPRTNGFLLPTSCAIDQRTTDSGQSASSTVCFFISAQSLAV